MRLFVGHADEQRRRAPPGPSPLVAWSAERSPGGRASASSASATSCTCQDASRSAVRAKARVSLEAGGLVQARRARPAWLRSRRGVDVGLGGQAASSLSTSGKPRACQNRRALCRLTCASRLTSRRLRSSGRPSSAAVTSSRSWPVTAGSVRPRSAGVSPTGHHANARSPDHPADRTCVTSAGGPRVRPSALSTTRRPSSSSATAVPTTSGRSGRVTVTGRPRWCTAGGRRRGGRPGPDPSSRIPASQPAEVGGDEPVPVDLLRSREGQELAVSTGSRRVWSTLHRCRRRRRRRRGR